MTSVLSRLERVVIGCVLIGACVISDKVLIGWVKWVLIRCVNRMCQ